MEVSREEKLPPPPGIINSLKAGFDAIAMHVAAIIFPLVLDLFLWLGPRLRLTELFDAGKPYMLDAWKSGGIPAADIQRALDLYNSIIPNINLFWLLRTFPIGVSSLPFAQSGSTPLGAPVVLQVGILSLFGWIFLLNFVGWIGGGLYFQAVAKFAIKDNAQPVSVPRAVLQTIFLSVIWGILAAMIFMPLMFVIALLNQFSAILANLLFVFLSFVSLWVIVPLYFWSHGIFVKRENVFTSMLSSWRLTRFMLPGSSMFVLTIFLLAFGLNFLWSIPPQDSWMTLVGIFGHAFVTTALLAASFIYYRDTTAWLQTGLEKFGATAVKKA